MPCRINKRREWSGRMCLEAQSHLASVFVTLTIDELHLRARGHEEVDKRDMQLFFKRLRKAYGKVRYFCCGEYGERRGRPHYHAVIFGMHLLQMEVIQAAWPLGAVHVAEFTPATALYVTGYVAKKWTRAGVHGLFERKPEFALMSKGLGKEAVLGVAGSLTSAAGSAALSRVSDVPAVCRVSGKVLPMGRYLRGKLREAVGWKATAPGGALVEQRLELLAEPAEVRARRRAQTELRVDARLKLERSKRKL